MENKRRKVLTVLFMTVLITLTVLLTMGYQEKLKQTVCYKEFSVEPEEGYYEITDIQDYLKFAETVALGNKYEWCEIHLNSDLDFHGMDDVPVIGLSGEELLEFKGIFQGNGHTIRGLSILNPEGVSGMFANLGGAVINLRLEDCRFEGSDCGGITAKSMVNAVILNCDADVKTSGEIHGAMLL